MSSRLQKQKNASVSSRDQTNQLLRYNSAPEQVKRLQQGGISAATAFSNSAGSAGSAMSAPMGAVPSGSSGFFPL